MPTRVHLVIDDEGPERRDVRPAGFQEPDAPAGAGTRVTLPLDHVLHLLRCPHCARGLERDDAILRCDDGHAFDLARQGYVSLLQAGTGASTGDTADMVAARETFLAGGHYLPIAQALADAVITAQDQSVRTSHHPAIVDLGAGTGWYLGKVLDVLSARPDGAEAVGLALDAAKHAAQRAARAHPRIGAVVCDVWRPLPVADACVDSVLSVFAPRNADETLRILRPGGALVVVTPAAQHLSELVGALGLVTVDERKPARLRQQLARFGPPERECAHGGTRHLDHAAVRDLVAMGPSARHVASDELAARLGALPAPVPVTWAISVATYRRPPT